jgi:Protein of unknown function (DUF5818)
MVNGVQGRFMVKQFFCLVLLCGFLWLPSQPMTFAQTSPAVNATQTTVSGTIRATEVEGRCYQLQTDDGQRYELMGKFPKKDGLRVKVRGTLETDVMTICQVGRPLRVKSWRPIK